MKIITFFMFIFIMNLLSKQAASQAPNLGLAAGFAIFTGDGEFGNTGASTVGGGAGTGVGSVTGLPSSAVTGTIHVADAVATQAATAVNQAYSALASITCDTTIGNILGNGQILKPRTYCIGSSASLNGTLTLDAQGNDNAIFIFKINGAFSTATFTNIVLLNGASLCNLYWRVNGAFTLGDGSIFKGTLISSGAIILLEASSVYGRCLSTTGAIEMHNNMLLMNPSPTPSFITAGGPASFCANTNLTISGNNSGIWSSGTSDPTITINTSGDYFVVNTIGLCTATSNHVLVAVTPLPTDYGDLSTAVWPVASCASASCNVTGTQPSAYDASTNPFVVVWAGNSVSSETSTINGGSLTAGTDAFDDGLSIPTYPMTGGYTYPFWVTLQSNTPANVYYRFWFDWNNDGDFSNDLDGNGAPATYAAMVFANGMAMANVSVKPPLLYSPNYKVRLIVTDVNNTVSGTIPDFYRNGTGGQATPTALISLTNGEVEDYTAPALILPVTFGNISATSKNCNVYLGFDYLSQQQNQQFKIEHSVNGQNWKEITTFSNQGNLSNQSFSYIHTAPVAGINLYRIKQTEVDGTYNYSKTVQSFSTCAGKGEVVAYPNPVKSFLTVVMPSNAGNAQFKVSDATGKLLITISSQNISNMINTQSLVNGWYQLQVVTNGKVMYTGKFIKQ